MMEDDTGNDAIKTLRNAHSSSTGVSMNGGKWKVDTPSQVTLPVVVLFTLALIDLANYVYHLTFSFKVYRKRKRWLPFMWGRGSRTASRGCRN